MTKSRGILPERQYWNEVQLKMLRELYPNNTAQVCAIEINRPVSSIYSKAHELGIAKSEAFKASAASGRLDGVRGAHTRFKQGQKSWNKGTHFTAGGRSAETRFKPNQKPHNTVPVGTTVMATIGYLKTKVAEPNCWKFTHHIAWEAVNGPIKKGMMLVFKDGDVMNCEVQNLELITKQEHLARHTIHNYPPELREVINLTGALKRKINNHGKRH